MVREVNTQHCYTYRLRPLRYHKDKAVQLRSQARACLLVDRTLYETGYNERLSRLKTKVAIKSVLSGLARKRWKYLFLVLSEGKLVLSGMSISTSCAILVSRPLLLKSHPLPSNMCWSLKNCRICTRTENLYEKYPTMKKLLIVKHPTTVLWEISITD